MAGVENLLRRTCKQTAVYWGTPVEDGEGGKTFDDPVEISCRWENKVQTLARGTGGVMEEVVSQAEVYVLQDLDEGGYLCLCDLDDLDSAADPLDSVVENAYEIKMFEKIPALGRTSEFVRKAYL